MDERKRLVVKQAKYRMRESLRHHTGTLQHQIKDDLLAIVNDSSLPPEVRQELIQSATRILEEYVGFRNNLLRQLENILS